VNSTAAVFIQINLLKKMKTKKELIELKNRFLKTKKPYFPLNQEWNKTLNNLQILISRKR
tara:strand:+ start:1013 stop:1192 length:180 start_codon:yes stop_codon:yes gene_type:complete